MPLISEYFCIHGKFRVNPGPRQSVGQTCHKSQSGASQTSSDGMTSSTAAQVGAYRLSAGDNKTPSFHGSGTQSPPPGAVTWVMFIQSIPGSQYDFDSFNVYVEEPHRIKSDGQVPRDIVRACEKAALSLYPKWASEGVMVNVFHALLGGQKKRNLQCRSSWKVVNGRVHKVT